MTTPPRTAELLLEALGAHPDFRDDVLGDLAEEFALRAAWDGAPSARRWYWREAARVAPHLLRDWVRGLGASDVARLAGVVISSYVLVAVVALFVLLTVRGLLAGLGVVPGASPLASAGLLLQLLGLTFGACFATAGGAVAASLDTKTPVVSALALGVVWSCAELLVLTLAGPVPAWYRVGAPLLVMLGTAAGGVLRVRGAARFGGAARGASAQIPE